MVCRAKRVNFKKNLSHDAAFFKYLRVSSTRKVYFAERSEAVFENFEHKSALVEHLRAETIDKVYLAERFLENFK